MFRFALCFVHPHACGVELFVRIDVPSQVAHSFVEVRTRYHAGHFSRLFVKKIHDPLSCTLDCSIEEVGTSRKMWFMGER